MAFYSYHTTNQSATGTETSGALCVEAKGCGTFCETSLDVDEAEGSEALCGEGCSGTTTEILCGGRSADVELPRLFLDGGARPNLLFEVTLPESTLVELRGRSVSVISITVVEAALPEAGIIARRTAAT